MYYLFFVAVLFFSHASSNTVDQTVVSQTVELNSCQTPRKTTGSCVPYQQCPSFAELLKTVLGSQGLAFLAQWKCGKPGEEKVCCDNSTILYNQRTTTTEYPKHDYSVCGQSFGAVPRILSRDGNSTLGLWPSVVALGYGSGSKQNRLWRCGGSLITDRWVITAGHCVDNGGNLNLTTARMGELHLDENVKDGASPVDIDIEKIVLHPKFVLSPLQNDIALLRLSRPVTFTNVGEKMLRDTEADIIGPANCTQMYKQASRNPIDIRSLCAREVETACHDNSGWPLMIFLRTSTSTRERQHLAGTMSFGGGCTFPGFPAVFTNIAYFSDWIRNVTGI